MPALIRYPILGCMALFLAACGSSGSSKLAPQPPASSNGSGTPSSFYADVEYLITDIPGAIAKFVSDPPEDTDAKASTRDLTSLRNNIVAAGTRYLSTGARVTRTTTGGVVNESVAATCTDGANTGASGPAKCVFAADELLPKKPTTYHLGSTNTTDDVEDVGLYRFSGDRQTVMSYRDVELLQLRTAHPNPSELKWIYKDSGGKVYLLTTANVIAQNLDDVTLPAGVTKDTAPAFSALLAVYKDSKGNEYLLTLDNVTNKNLTGVTRPSGVTTLPAFSDLSQTRESFQYEYVGYGGVLGYSMFFVGIHRFFDDDGELEHTRFMNASLGRTYDHDTETTGIQSPEVSLTGKGVMVGVESRNATLEHHLVQGDVGIDYDHANTQIDVKITNVKRLVGSGDAWYADSSRLIRLNWQDLPVTNSEFSSPGTSSNNAGTGELDGSFYGTKDSPEVGGVFHDAHGFYQIIGSFGSKLSEKTPPSN